MSVTIKQIAKKAAVTHATVSRVLNNADVPIKASTRTKVMQAAQALGYQPNPFARGLRTGRSYLVGITSTAPVRLLFNQPYAGELYTGFGDILSDHNYSMVFHQIRDVTEPQDGMRLAQSGMVDGLVYILLADAEEDFMTNQLPLLTSLKVPFVVVHSLRQRTGFAQVGLNCRTGSYKATRHLLEHGYATVGLVTRGSGDDMNAEHAAGYTMALKENGQQYKAALHFRYEKMDNRGGYALADRLLGDRTALPRALLITDDSVALGMLRRFSEAGIRTPEDLAVIGFGNVINPDQVILDLTTIDQPAREKGRRAAQQLLGMIDNRKEIPEPVILEPELIIRKSCGC